MTGSDQRHATIVEVLSRTTSTEITTLASNMSADQLQTGNFGFQDTVYFATWIPSSADLQSTLWFIDDIALINSSSTPSTTHPNCIWQPCIQFSRYQPSGTIFQPQSLKQTVCLFSVADSRHICSLLLLKTAVNCNVASASVSVHYV